ncbi:MAG: hypothetical protein SGPRY_005546 [Prymnesium sp.]
MRAAAWRAEPASLPQEWPERSDWCGAAAREAARAELRYLSRRRADAEDSESLAREALPTPTEPPALEARPTRVDASWPEGAPQPHIAIEQLFFPGVYVKVQRAISEVAGQLCEAEKCVQAGTVPGVIPSRVPEVYSAVGCQPQWARERVWDTHDPTNCVPVEPFSPEDPPAHDLCPRFFEEWGRRLRWPDEDMLYRAMWEGGKCRSACRWDTVVHTHHLGLRQHFEVARKSVEADTGKGWITRGSPHLMFVPSRLVPKNVISQSKWRMGDGGDAVRVQKWRVTTDDSKAAASTDSRNDEIDRAELGNVSLPTIQQLARASGCDRALGGGRLGDQC